MSVARIYRVATPYNGSELAEIDYEQSADTMYLAHLDHAPTKLTRASHTSWAFASLNFGARIVPPTGVTLSITKPNTDAGNSGNAFYPTESRYVVTSIDDDTGQESRVSAIVVGTNDLNLKKNYNTISWAAVAGIERYRIYKSVLTGDFGYIGGTDQLSFRDDNIGADLSDGPPQGFNPFPGVNDYPSTVAFYQQRLGWGRTNNKPNAMWFSKSGEYENMDITRPLKASDSISFALVAGKVNAVNQIVSMTNLLALTSDSVFSINGGSEGFISPTNIVTARQNGRGGSRLNPIVIDQVTFYQTAVGNSIRSLGYEFQSDGYTSNDMTIFSPHFFRGLGIVSWAYTAEPLSVIWAARSDGALLAFTWQQEHQVWGWTLCSTDGLVESVCAISEFGEDRLYLTVRRTINGTSRVFVERLATTNWSAIDDACFMDAAVSYTFTTPQTKLINLQHLEAKTVVVLADGAVIEGLKVTNGTVTLTDPVSRAMVGLPYTATIETLPLAIQTQAGWTIAKPQSAARVNLRVLNSRGFKVGPTDAKLDEPRPRNLEPFGSAPGLITGLVESILQPHISGGINVVVQSSLPLPLTLTEVLYDPKVQD